MNEELKDILRELKQYDGKSVSALRMDIRKKIQDGDADLLFMTMVNNVMQHLRKCKG